MGTPHDDAVKLVKDAAGPLEKLWGEVGWTLGGLDASVSFSRPERAEFYVGAAGMWLATANQVLFRFSESDPDPVIDQLGGWLDVIRVRRVMLTQRGFGSKGPGADALREFWTAVEDEVEKKTNYLIPVLVVLAILFVISR